MTGPATTPSVAGQIPVLYRGTPVSDAFVPALDAILRPLIDGLDTVGQCFAPGSAPSGVLRWLEWVTAVSVDPAWSEDLRRKALAAGPTAYLGRGTATGLASWLKAVTGTTVTVSDPGDVISANAADADLPPLGDSFRVVVTAPSGTDSVQLGILQQLAEAAVPVYVPYTVIVESSKS
ncbi:phage tail protein [Streptomyces yaizuensis]|uniref:Phage tail protein n=1 Tax=Streptomyces yaizuensis TaxID=2989713 RepID=A0ABQ5NYK7_9ACTN|nr:phage tail protein [Streptomyces sp. YSPA8]GLF95270.1 phage tail protein [Streptomyces sp. YSPA8]